jgi:transposase InsO family protein
MISSCIKERFSYHHLLSGGQLSEAHGTGHEGAEKTFCRLRASFYTPTTARLVKEFIQGCEVCQKNKTEHLHPAGLLQPLSVPSSVWSDIAMDFVEGFSQVAGKSVVLTVVDRFLKYAHFIALDHPYTTASVVKVFFDSIVRLHVIPRSIVSDRDVVFTSKFWTELFKLSGVKLQLSSAFHPQTDGQSEVTNRILGVYLRCLAGDRPKNWLRWLSWAEYCYNMSYQSALKTTPFEVVYGRAPPTLLSYQSGISKAAAVDRQLPERDLFLSEIRDRLLHAQQLMKRNFDGSTATLNFRWVIEFGCAYTTVLLLLLFSKRFPS